MLRIGYLALLLCLMLALAAGPACDTSSDGSGGGGAAPTGYTQADLAGQWAMAGPLFGRYFLKFDDQGKLLHMKNDWEILFPWTGRVTVLPDGSLKGNICLPYFWSIFNDCFFFNRMSFRSKDRISGKLTFFTYDLGGPKYIEWTTPAKMGRYPR